MLHSNLGGHGPDSGEPNLRYGGVGSVGGAPFDLLVEVAEGHEYRPGYHSLDSGFAKINLAFGTSTKLRFRFVWPGSTDEVPLQQVNLNIYDFDTKMALVNSGNLTFSATIAGTVDEFDALAYSTKLSELLDTPVENITLHITPGSVNVEVVAHVPDAAQDMTLLHSLACDATGCSAEAMALLSELFGVQVEGALP